MAHRIIRNVASGNESPRRITGPSGITGWRGAAEYRDSKWAAQSRRVSQLAQFRNRLPLARCTA